ncbi:Nucleotidyltransferase family protein [Raphanus sativus]|nr:Nucleotidyltransferase family protein [Raphanus sativus]
MEPEAQAFVYDALPPLSLSDTNQSPPTLDESHNYSVFRNEISDLTETTAPVESETVDFFSLDVDADAGENENGDEFVTPVVAASKKSRKRRKEKEAEEPRLETNWFNEKSCSKIPMLQLHKEIVDFSEFLLPTLEEKAQRDAAMDSVRSVIQYIWPDCKVEVFGSYKTGLYLPTSDIDVVILESGITNPQLGLKALSRALSQRGIAKSMQVIARARVPIIKFVEKKSSISFDLSFDMENGPKAAEFIQDAVLKLPPLRPLCLILKVFLQQRELNEVYSGGIGSYALLAMLIAFLKYLKDGRSPPEHNLGVLLVKFFDFYGRKLNTADVGVSCKKGGSFFSKSNKGFLNQARPGLISIEDPETPENDIGKSSFNYFQIRSAFAMALSTLTNTKAILALGPNRSILGTIIRPDRILLERKGGKNGDVTFNSLLPGAGEPLPMSASGKSNGGLFCNWQLEEDEEGSFPRGDAVNGDSTPVLVDTPGKVTTKESSRKKKSKSKSKKKVVDDDDDEEEEPSSKKRRRKNKISVGGQFELLNTEAPSPSMLSYSASTNVGIQLDRVLIFNILPPPQQLKNDLSSVMSHHTSQTPPELKLPTATYYYSLFNFSNIPASLTSVVHIFCSRTNMSAVFMK